MVSSLHTTSHFALIKGKGLSLINNYDVTKSPIASNIAISTFNSHIGPRFNIPLYHRPARIINYSTYIFRVRSLITNRNRWNPRPIHKAFRDMADLLILLSVAYTFSSSEPIANRNRQNSMVIHNVRCEQRTRQDYQASYIYFRVRPIAYCNWRSPRLIHKARCD